MPLRFRLLTFAVTILFFLPAIAAVRADLNQRADREGGQPAVLPVARLKAGGTVIEVEVARTPEHQAAGLMRVRRLPDNEGMLFVQREIGHASFWMRNTVIPLSIAYLNADGVIREIHAMRPLDETPVRSRSDDIAFALEMNLHWFKLNGLAPGDRLEPVGTTWSALRKDD